MTWARDGSGLLVKRLRGKTYPQRIIDASSTRAGVLGRFRAGGKTSHPAWWRSSRKRWARLPPLRQIVPRTAS